MEDIHASSATRSSYAIHVDHKGRKDYLHVLGADELTIVEEAVTADGLVKHASTQKQIAHTMLKMAF